MPPSRPRLTLPMLLLCASAITLGGCAGDPPRTRMANCPQSPNCVASRTGAATPQQTLARLPIPATGTQPARAPLTPVSIPEGPLVVTMPAPADGRTTPAAPLHEAPLMITDAVIRAVEQLPGCTVVQREDEYLRAECRSKVFGFVDDLELVPSPEGGLDVRSAARLGWYDFGVNRKRVEMLRALLSKPQ